MVGLVSAWFIAKTANRQFLIWWKDPDMTSSFTIRLQYLFEDSKMNLNDRMYYYNWIDKRRELMTILNQKELFKSLPETVFISCNQFLCPFLHQDKRPAEAEIRACYQSLFTEFFQLSNKVLVALDSLQKEAKWEQYSHKIAFQVRFGDHQIRRFMNPKQEPNPAGLEPLIKTILPELKRLTDSKTSTVVYFSSDCDAHLCLPILETYCKETKIVACPLPVEHIDRTQSTTEAGHFKLLIDFLMMASCNTFLIPWHSNLSRVAILSSPFIPLQGVTYSHPLSNPQTIQFDVIQQQNASLLYCKASKPNVRIN